MEGLIVLAILVVNAADGQVGQEQVRHHLGQLRRLGEQAAIDRKRQRETDDTPGRMRISS